MNDTEYIKKRLTDAVLDKDTGPLVLQDYAFTLCQIGIPEEQAKKVAQTVIEFIRSSSTLEEAEENIRKLFEETKVGETNVLALVKAGLAERNEKVLGQLTPYLQGIQGKVFDYGMGSGGVTQKLKDELHLDIEGGDVRDFRAPHVTVPFVKLQNSMNEQGRIVDVQDKYYEAAVLTNVIHHEKDNENILKELDRIVSKKLVIIETIPVGNTPEEIVKDSERTFANDVLWNRFFNYADLPVPGTYESPEGWIKRFESFGWKATHSEDLGYDQKTIRDVHHLLVFER